MDQKLAIDPNIEYPDLWEEAIEWSKDVFAILPHELQEDALMMWTICARIVAQQKGKDEEAYKHKLKMLMRIWEGMIHGVAKDFMTQSVAGLGDIRADKLALFATRWPEVMHTLYFHPELWRKKAQIPREVVQNARAWAQTWTEPAKYQVLLPSYENWRQGERQGKCTYCKGKEK